MNDFLANKEKELNELNIILQKIFSGHYSDNDIDNLLNKLDGIENIDDLKEIVKSCLGGNPKTIQDLLLCIKNKVQKKLEDANGIKLEEEQKKRTIKNSKV